MESLFFCLIKRTKNQGWGMVVKAQISILCEISLRDALFCSLLNSLILSVIFREASDKPLAFQFVNKTQQYQGRKGIMNYGLWFINDGNCTSLNRVDRLRLRLRSPILEGKRLDRSTTKKPHRLIVKLFSQKTNCYKSWIIIKYK